MTTGTAIGGLCILVLIGLLESRKSIVTELGYVHIPLLRAFLNILIFLALVSLIIMGYKAI